MTKSRPPPIPDQIRTARTAAHLSQAQLAESTGLQQSAIARYETGERDPNLRTLRILAGALNTVWLVYP
jgi:transcriptional regulator with XRE-family HTH domain